MQPVVEQRGYAGTRTSPFGIGATIAVHAAVVGVFLMLPKEIIEHVMPGTLITHAIPLDKPPPPPIETKRDEKKPLQRDQTKTPVIDDVDFVDLTKNPFDLGDRGTVLPPLGGGETTVINPPKDPVLTEAMPEPKAMRDFQPSYPPSMQRAQEEGKVTVRVRIGPDGRVLSVEKIFATNDDFWAVTERQAMRKWRFRPATRDGVPVEGTKIMTVHFKLDE